MEAQVKQRGLAIFARIDHAAGAANIGKTLRPTEVLIFGKPQGGTPFMECAQTVGIDLPLKPWSRKTPLAKSGWATTTPPTWRNAMPCPRARWQATLPKPWSASPKRPRRHKAQAAAPYFSKYASHFEPYYLNSDFLIRPEAIWHGESPNSLQVPVLFLKKANCAYTHQEV